jgi:hypothetical protein
MMAASRPMTVQKLWECFRMLIIAEDPTIQDATEGSYLDGYTIIMLDSDKNYLGTVGEFGADFEKHEIWLSGIKFDERKSL